MTMFMPAMRILLQYDLTTTKVMIFLKIFFFNPKYLWTRDIKCKGKYRWPASLLKTSLVHRNSSHILISKIKLSGFSLGGRLVWNGSLLTTWSRSSDENKRNLHVLAFVIASSLRSSWNLKVQQSHVKRKNYFNLYFDEIFLGRLRCFNKHRI